MMSYTMDTLRQRQQAYRCEQCQMWYVQGVVGCFTIHAPGECCHAGDIPIMEPIERMERNDGCTNEST